MEKQISIIIPTYNMEVYIGKCLDSLLIPEIDQVEILVVNDGSKDRSSEIAHSYADRYPQSIRVIDKENGNYGSCINAALPLATGRYVKILDADDTFDTAAFSDFVRLLPTLDADLLLTPFRSVDEEGLPANRGYEIPNIKVNQSIPLSIAIQEKIWHANISMHAFAYKSSLFNNLDYFQTPGISFTDTEWICYPLKNVETIRTVNISPLYVYLMGREGQTMDPKRIDSHIPHIIRILQRMREILLNIKEESVFKQIMTLHLQRLLGMYFLWVVENRVLKFYDCLKNFDLELKDSMPDLYYSMNNSRHWPYIKYSFIEDFRKSGYSKNYHFPKWVTTSQTVIEGLSKAKSRIKNFLKR